MIDSDSTKKRKASLLLMIILIFAGETIYLLPFVLPRIFRPTFLEVFQINNFELGTCFSIYGIVGLISYFFGGIIADRFLPRKLMATALFTTALGGFFMATYPSTQMLHVIYAYWGCTTILLFWAAMIKATRQWGGTDSQGKAFGILDGGRGMVAAVIGTLGVMLFAAALGNIDEAVFADQQAAFRSVILYSSFFVLAVGVLVLTLLRLPGESEVATTIKSQKYSTANLKEVLSMKAIWYLMFIILSGYVGYKMTDDFSLYAREVMMYNEVESAQVGTFLLYMRPIVGIFVGFMADRSKASTFITGGFALMMIGSLALASGWVDQSGVLIFFISSIATALGVFSIRALYFAVLEEWKIPFALTGTAVGLMSLIGYTPDIFIGPVMGYLLDGSPGPVGHQQLFAVLAGFSVLGLIASWRFSRTTF